MLDTILKKYEIIQKEKIDYGWSGDIKYHLKDKNQNGFLLRIVDKVKYQKLLWQFKMLKEIEKLNLNISKPIEIGILNDNQVYIILTWIAGENAKEVLEGLEHDEAYNIGLDAGKILKCIHNVKVESSEKWWDIYQNKTIKKIEYVDNNDIKFSKKNEVINFIETNMHILKKQEMRLQHGDFHVGNMVINDKKIGIIDFDKLSVADPIDDFKPFVWNVWTNEYFQRGIIDGYFNKLIPDDFFLKLAVYAADSIIGQTIWSKRFGEHEINVAKDVTKSVLFWYDDFKLTIPKWYK